MSVCPSVNLSTLWLFFCLSMRTRTRPLRSPAHLYLFAVRPLLLSLSPHRRPLPPANVLQVASWLSEEGDNGMAQSFFCFQSASNPPLCQEGGAGGLTGGYVAWDKSQHSRDECSLTVIVGTINLRVVTARSQSGVCVCVCVCRAFSGWSDRPFEMAGSCCRRGRAPNTKGYLC